MSSVGAVIPNLKLFPLYPGGPVVQANQGPNALNANSSFKLGGNNFLPAFQVNGGPITNPLTQDTFLRVNKDQTLSRVPLSDARNFNTNLALDANSSSGLKVAPVNPVAPKSPRKYQDYLAALAISDLNSGNILTPNNQFNLRWLGLTATTDAAGEVDSLKVKPSLQTSVPSFDSKKDPNYLLLNQAEIAERAILKSANSKPIPPPNQPAAAKKAAKVNPAVQNLKLNAPNGLLNIKAADEQKALAALREQAKTNPVIDNLLKLQPQEQGLSTTGYQASLDVEQSRKLATVKAGYDVNTPDTSRKADLAQLVQGAKDTQDTSALTQARAKDGQIPMAPSMPAQNKSGAELGAGMSSGGNDFQAGAGADSMDKKGKGGYIPFSTTSGGGSNPFASGFGAGTGSGGNNPFKGTSTGSQQQDQRRPFTLTA